MEKEQKEFLRKASSVVYGTGEIKNPLLEDLSLSIIKTTSRGNFADSKYLFEFIPDYETANLLAQFAMTTKEDDEIITILPGYNRSIKEYHPKDYTNAVVLAAKYEYTGPRRDFVMGLADGMAWEKENGLTTNQESNIIKGQGKMEKTEMGALRESNDGRGRFDLLPYEAIEALAKWYEAGIGKYEERNWEQGISVKDCINRMNRHALKAASGWTDEDHLAAVMWNAAAAITMMQRKPECNDHVWHAVHVGVDTASKSDFVTKSFNIPMKSSHDIQIPEFMKKKMHVPEILDPKTTDVHRLRIGLNQILDTRVRNNGLTLAESNILRDICESLVCTNFISVIPEDLLDIVQNELEMMNHAE